MSLSATSALLIKMSVVSVAKKLPLTRACALLDMHGVAVSHAGLSPADVAVPCACLELRTPLSGVTYTHVWCYGHPCLELRTPCSELRTPLTGVTDIPVWSYVHPCLVFRTPLSGATDPLSGSLPTSRRMKYWSLGIRHCSVRFIAEPAALSLDILLELSGKERKFLDSISSF